MPDVLVRNTKDMKEEVNALNTRLDQVMSKVLALGEKLERGNFFFNYVISTVFLNVLRCPLDATGKMTTLISKAFLR